MHVEIVNEFWPVRDQAVHLTPAHIKTHLWDLSTNLSKLNILLKLKSIVLYES